MAQYIQVLQWWDLAALLSASAEEFQLCLVSYPHNTSSKCSNYIDCKSLINIMADVSVSLKSFISWIGRPSRSNNNDSDDDDDNNNNTMKNVWQIGQIWSLVTKNRKDAYDKIDNKSWQKCHEKGYTKVTTTQDYLGREMYDYIRNKWSHRKSNKRVKEEFWKPYQENIQ